MLAAGSVLSGDVLSQIANPMVEAMMFLIPAAIGISAIHKLMEHRESGGGVLVELITKGGGAILVLKLIQAFALHN
jgi:hypothetical protein